jgi:ribonuclease HII
MPRSNSLPTLLRENKARSNGYKCIAGIDEAGRGPLAGPVLAACVVLKGFDFTVKIDDSKRLTKLQRESAFEQIIKKAHVGIGIVNEDIIEEININNATILAMQRAVSDIAVRPDLLLIDGILKLKFPFLLKQACIISGDRKCLSIACASIAAKVIRDRMMVFYDCLFPKWGLAAHKGYGTRRHFKAIRKFGLSVLHRKDFVE